MIPLQFSSSIFWDMDGVLFRLSEQAKQAHLRYDWDEFYKIQLKAEPIAHMIKLARAMSLDHNNIIVTAREERWREETRIQLREHHIPFEALFMRPVGNLEPSPHLKMKMYEQFSQDFDGGKQVTLIIDDRKDVVNKFQSKGIPALHYIGV